MKMTKLLGAVLGVVMVATLFVGAGAAYTDNDLGTIYTGVLYNKMGDLILQPGSTNLTWDREGGGSISFNQEPNHPDVFYLPMGTSGKFTKIVHNTRYIIHVTYPSIQVSGVIYDKEGRPTASIIDNTIGTDDSVQFYDDEDSMRLSGTNVTARLAFTNPDGTLTSEEALGKKDEMDRYQMKEVDLGQWKVRTLFMKGDGSGKVGTMSSVAPDYFYGDVYSFTVISSDTSKTITSNVENLTQGNYATIKVSAPTGYWDVSVETPSGKIPKGQPNINVWEPVGNQIQATVHVDTSGEQTFVVQSNSTDDVKVKLYKQGTGYKTVLKELTIKVNAGAVSAHLEKDAVYIGDEFDINGTNDLNGKVNFYIKGTNYPLSVIYDTDRITPLIGSGKEWTATVDTSQIYNIETGKSLDAGTYTVYVARLAEGVKADWIKSTDDFDNSDLVGAYTAISVPFVQPFIRATADDVVVQGDDLEISGNAEGKPSKVRLYVFGTNYFNGDDISVRDDGTFSWSKKIKEPDVVSPDGWNMATGQYFAVVQHPMYDKHFNLAPLDPSAETYTIDDADNNPYFKMGANIVSFKTDRSSGDILFSTSSRQSANAAQALIDAMASQDIDDMQAHFSFVVAGPTSYVNAIPSKVTKGQTLTISGTTTGHKNDIVSVELLSTAFAAVPKETVGSASFSTLTTRIGDNGVWSVSFDTSSLNADEYTVSIAVGQLDATTAKVQIVDGPVPTPTQTSGPKPTSSGQPTVAPTSQPTTTPQTPGFGALASLVGLGAVAVLLLRRE